MPPRTWIVMPTYNEAPNLQSIVRAVGAELDRFAWPDVRAVGAAPEQFPAPEVPTAGAPAPDYRVLVVDDNSPDGTGAIADGLAAELDWVEVLHRPRKEGLGQAYLQGFAHALARGAHLLVQMDADFSHDPRYLGDLLRAVPRADLVLGSRYVQGGGVRDWGLLRRVVSRGGGVYARAMLGVAVRDLTGGFKCIRRQVLESIDLGSIRAEGYGFQIEVTYRALKAGFRVVEIPIIFADRRAGTSKMSAQIAFEAMWLVPRLRGWAPDGSRAHLDSRV